MRSFVDRCGSERPARALNILPGRGFFSYRSLAFRAAALRSCTVAASLFVAVQEVAQYFLPEDSTIELLYVIHSRLPVIPDFPPWAVTIAAAHGESVRAQTRHASEVLAAAAKRLQMYQRQATIVTKTVEGVPKDEILREAWEWGADRIVMGSHGRGRADRAILGSTAAAVAARAPCTVQIARRRSTETPAMPSAYVA
jgi:nucleotide-binding universal stress UspA family protein